jgi:hypothetical protein
MISKMICTTICAVLLSGCVPVIIGSSAAGGYVLSNDAAEAFLPCSYQQAWESAYAVLSETGKITYFKESS